MAESPLFFLIAGEASGDLLGARLMHALKKLYNGNVRFAGVGGPRMQAEGMELLFPQAELAHFGLFLKQLPHLYKRLKQTVEEVRYRRPDALITIDAPDFCFRVAKRLKGEGIPLIHYVAPTVWVWRKGRAKKIARFLDHLMTLLPFEPPYFTKEGLDTTFVGHSIIESGADKGDAERFRHNHGIPAKATLLAVLPGSRGGEIARLMPVFEKTVARLKEKHPALYVVIPTIPSMSDNLKEQTQDWPVPVTIVESDADKYDAFAASHAALACSGTVLIELAMAGLPSVTAYKVSTLSVIFYGIFVVGTYANLVNIMHKRMVVPEFLQFNCTPKNLAEAVDELLSNETVRQKQVEALGEVAAWLTPGSKLPSEYAAETVDRAVKKLKLTA